MQNEEKIIELLEEIRDQQKTNLEKALEMQKRVKKVFVWLIVFMFLISLAIQFWK